MNKGFTLFLAVVITGTLLLIATGITALAVKQSKISSFGHDSQIAFYAADIGLECALYWDVKNPSGDRSAFDPSASATINCNLNAANSGNSWVVGGASVSSFTMTFLPDPSCATVTVTKSGSNTAIESLGYNNCNASASRRVERAVRANY